MGTRYKTFSFLSLALMASAGIAGADTILIDFDFDTNNVAIESGTRLDSVYSSRGVIFEETLTGGCGDGAFASNNCLTQGTTSPPNVVTLCGGGGCSDISENAHGLIRAIFSAPATQVCVDFIPAHGGDSGVLRAYDSGHALLSESISTAGVTGPVCVSGTGIASVEFSGYLDHFGWFDNLSATLDTSPVVTLSFGGIKARYR